VVSYGSSPPAEVVYSDPPVAEPPTSVMESSCFRQIEYVGRLKGTTKPDEADKLIEFLLGTTFQESMPLTLFVFPVNQSARLPEVFEKFAVKPNSPLTIDADEIAEKREKWIEQWADSAL
jgi:thiamine transport system substrate-binding protein